MTRRYYINCRSWKKFCVSLDYIGSDSYLFVNGVKIYQFKAKNSELIDYPVILENISKDFSAADLKQTGLNGYVYHISIDYESIDIEGVLDIRKYLIKKNNIMFEFIKKVFITLLSLSRLLANIVNVKKYLNN